MAEIILQVNRITRTFTRGAIATEVLHGIEMQLAKGEMAALIGPSGSGKSTLLNIIGLLDKPSTGTVAITGTATHTLNDQALTRFRGDKIGFVFQFHHLLPAFTAAENVMIPLMAAQGRRTREMEMRAIELLDRVGLQGKYHRRATDLSGGEQQRVAIARALVANPALLLADEPTGNLDTTTSEQVFELLRTLQREQGTTMLIVTHDTRIAQRCDRIFSIQDGQLKDEGDSHLR